MNASNSVIGKLQLTLGLSKGSNDTLALTRLESEVWSFVVIFLPFTVNTRNLSSSILLVHWNELLNWTFFD